MKFVINTWFEHLEYGLKTSHKIKHKFISLVESNWNELKAFPLFLMYVYLYMFGDEWWMSLFQSPKCLLYASRCCTLCAPLCTSYYFVMMLNRHIAYIVCMTTTHRVYVYTYKRYNHRNSMHIKLEHKT